MKTLFISIALLGIVTALAAAGVFMLRGGAHKDERASQMARALAVRVGLSIALFVCILLAWKLGWIQPTGLPTGR